MTKENFTKQTGVRAVLWWSSPSCARILERLECKGPGRPDELGAELHITHKYAENLMRLLKASGVVRVVRYRRNLQGAPTPVYALGPGKSVAIPKQESHAVRSRRRREALKARYGVEIANKVLNPKAYGYPVVYIDGERVTPGSARSYVGGGT